MAVYRDNNSGIYRIQFVLGGRTFVKSSKTTVKAVALQMECEWKAQVHSQVLMGAKEEITIQEMFEKYLSLPHAQNTIDNAKSVQRLLGEFTNLKVKASAFRQIELERYVEKCRADGNKDSTIANKMRVFTAVWNSVNKKVYNVPELSKPKVKPGKGRLVYFTEAEEVQLLNYLSTRQVSTYGKSRPHEFYDIFVLLLDTGARNNEIAQLTWNQVDLETGTLDIWRQKTSSSTYLMMTNRVREALTRRKKEARHRLWVFPNQQRNNHRTLDTTYMNKVIKDAGIADKTVHHLRHGFATKLLKGGFTLAEVQKLMGHADIATTAKNYAHLETSDVSSKAVAFFNNEQVEKRRSMMKAV